MDDAQERWERYQAERQAILKEFGLKLARRRGPKESQEKLSERANLHRNTVGLFERGEREPGLLALLALANTFDTTLDELAAGLAAPKTKRPHPNPTPPDTEESR